ncbi:MAG: Bifunctional PGK/TIM [Alphaproteobacteria bacterium MarineAlpha9_Bin4]|nr:phosphoglycerate kinase [Pelagibacterales bacterium]PPR25758.1 MAG: Bifunctional PGK/TIM [Alphaproteobacteria bacterium MarineAlpha9_Bin4]
MNLKTLDNLDLKGKRVLLRCDLNVPFDLEGKVLDSTKIERHKLTIDELIHKQAKIIIISHLGRPKGSYQENLSLKKVLKVFANKIKVSQVTVMPFCKPDILKKVINDVSGGTITFMENIRFHPEEEKNDEKFAKELAECADYFVNDSFSVSHRKHVSTYGLSKFLPTVVGRYLELEIRMLDKIFNNMNKPVMAVIGGSKISTKIILLNNLLKKVDKLVIGGAMANTFLAAKNFSVGNSLIEKDKVYIAKDILLKAKQENCDLILPQDVIVAKGINEVDGIKNVGVDEIEEGFSVFDIGEKSIEKISNEMASCKTVFWNGPLGLYEQEPFDNSTNVIGRTAAILTKGNIITSVVGGGDTVAALNKKNLTGGFSFVSIAGGALVEWLEGKTLPGLEFLSN